MEDGYVNITRRSNEEAFQESLASKLLYINISRGEIELNITAKIPKHAVPDTQKVNCGFMCAQHKPVNFLIEI